jgi:hypothetical protein
MPILAGTSGASGDWASFSALVYDNNNSRNTASSDTFRVTIRD